MKWRKKPKRRVRPAIITVQYCKPCAGQGVVRGWRGRDKKCRYCNGTGRM